LDQKIPSLPAHEVAVGFMRLGAMIGDTHSRIAAPQLKVVPIEVEWFADELRVTRASPEFRDLLGSRVLQIGNVSVQEAQRRIATVIATGSTSRSSDCSVHSSCGTLTSCTRFGLRLTPTAFLWSWTRAMVEIP
jgi:hypothetical protein